MLKAPILVAIAAVAALSGCAMTTRGTEGQIGARAILTGADGVGHGSVTVVDVAGATRLSVDANGLAPGMHGLHVHAVGRCEGPGFTTAGPHWNPEAKLHGRDNPGGAHRGDLPNLMVGGDGRGRATFDLPTNAAALTESEGKAIIIHADIDDYRTDPGGNSGARVVCGVFVAG